MNANSLLCVVLTCFGFEEVYSRISEGRLTSFNNVSTPFESETKDIHTNSIKYETSLNDLENCTIEVDNSTAERFIKEVQNKKYDFAFLRMRFQPNINFTENGIYLYPYIWSWTHNGEDGLFPVLEYPYDFGLLSMDFLNRHVNYKVKIVMHIHPKSCSEKMTLGEQATNVLVFQTYKKLGSRLRTNGTNVFCYTEKEDMYSTNRLYFYLSHFFGLDDGYIHRVCYREGKQGYSRVKVYETSFTWALKIWTWLTFFFCPLLIHLFAHDRRGSKQSLLGRNNYQEIEDVCTGAPDAEIKHMNENDEDWLYKGDTPMSLFVLLKDFICFKVTGPISNRFRRILLILLSPCLLYINIGVYRLREYNSTYPRLQANIPIGFNSMLYGFYPSMKNWNYFFGGPYIMLSVYFVVTLISFCIPENLSIFLTQHLQSGNKGDMIDAMLGLNGQSIENLSGIPYTKSCGFRMLSNFMKARNYLLLNIKFWKQVLSHSTGKCFGKLKKLVGCYFDSKILKFCLLILTLPIWIMLIIFSVLLIIFIILYYGFPMIFIVKHVLATYLIVIFNWMETKVEPQGYRSKYKKVKMTLFKSIVFIVFFILSCDVVFAFGLWFNVGLSWLWKVIGFTFVGLIVYPKDVVGYAVMAITSLFYLWKCIQNTSSAYTELFNQSIDLALLVNEKQKPPSFIVQQDIFYIHDSSAEFINKVCINGVSYNLEQISRSPDVDIRRRCPRIVKYKDDIPGIPATLFFAIVEQIRPLRKELFHSLIKLAFTIQFLYSTISTIQHFERSYNLAAIAQVIATVFVGLLPLLAEMIGMVSSAHYVMELDIQKRRIERKITEYYNKELKTESDEYPSQNRVQII